MPREKHPILYNLIGTVLGGLILSCVLYFVPGAYPLLVRVIKSAWGFLSWRIPTPLWLLALLVIPTIAIVVIAVAAFLTPAHVPEFYSYTEDRLFNAIWRWQYGSSGIWDLASFCQSCESRLVYSDTRALYGPTLTKLICEHCSREITETEGDYDYLEARVKREIDRRIRTGEYKRSLPAST
jgi:hypothetical protein